MVSLRHAVLERERVTGISSKVKGRGFTMVDLPFEVHSLGNGESRYLGNLPVLCVWVGLAAVSTPHSTHIGIVN